MTPTLPTQLPGPTLAPPSLAALVEREPRGGALDHGAIVRGAQDVPTLPGARETGEREAYRQRLVAANRALDGLVVNEAGKGAIEGLGAAALAVVALTLGPEAAVFGALAWGAAALFGGGRR
jgi:hypothetical protein